MDPSKNTNTTSTPNNSPPVSPPHPPSEHDNTPTTGANPIPEAEGSSENVIMKTAEEVWAELTAGDDEIYGNDGGDGGNEDGRAQDGDASRPVAIAVTAEGANVAVMRSVGAVGGSAKGSKKRKSNQVKDPPQGTPTCPECKRQFATWKAAFGHMRKHPERQHRGFFPPPTFTTTEPPPVPAAEGDGGNVDEEVQHIVRGLVVDLNRSIGAEEGSSAGGGSGGKKKNQPAPFVLPPGSAAALGPPPRLSAPLPPSQSRNRRNEPAPAEDEQNEDGRNKGFDLNRLPSSDDDETGEN